MKKTLKKIVKDFFIFRKFFNLVYKQEIDAFKSISNGPLFFPSGHFYSPIPSVEDIREFESQLQSLSHRNLEGINLKKDAQILLLEQLQKFYKEQPFFSQRQQNFRYFFENPAYSYSDGLFLYSMIRHLQPEKIVEIGSGYSSCLLLDVNELYFDNQINITCIEPFPELLLSLIFEKDKLNLNLIDTKLQNVELSTFSSLQENDILFIDSTHVFKINSDVSYIFSQILSCLQNGVVIHFHDIFYPFEYPLSWIQENRAWNELYILYAFLQYNRKYEILLFNNFMEQTIPEWFSENMPLCLKNPGGSIWLKKVSS